MPSIAAEDEIRYPSGFNLGDVVGWGPTGLIVLDKPSNTVVKAPFDHNNPECLLRLQREREAYERFEQRGGHQGLLAYHGAFESGIRLDGYAEPFKLQKLSNLWLPVASYESPGPRLSIQADLFALGSVFYEIMTGHPLYSDLDSTEIRTLYLNRRFPETGSLGAIGTSIEQCWQGNYSGAGPVVEKLRDISSISSEET
ncbi:hypothetical protein VTG60DRAFT_920 [Thermothelomyces hinnuleus]